MQGQMRRTERKGEKGGKVGGAEEDSGRGATLRRLRKEKQTTPSLQQSDELPSGLPSAVFGSHFGVISTYHCPALGSGVAALQALGPSAAPAQTDDA
jgi:hypothetical protein